MHTPTPSTDLQSRIGALELDASVAGDIDAVLEAAAAAPMNPTMPPQCSPTLNIFRPGCH